MSKWGTTYLFLPSNHERNHSLQTDLSKENLKDLEKPIEIENSTIIESKISSAKEKSEPRSCKFCQKQFNLRKVLNDHVTMVHTDFVPYGCEICNQSFAVESYKDDHMRHQHGITKSMLKQRVIP